MSRDHSCKATAMGPAHTHTCDQPGAHPYGPKPTGNPDHHCPTCEEWWVPASTGYARITSLPDQPEQAALW